MTDSLGNQSDAVSPVEDILERFHQLAIQTQNPMYAWTALNTLLYAAVDFDHPNGLGISRSVSIPAWLADHLYQFTSTLSSLAAGRDPRVEVPPMDFAKYNTWEEHLNSPELQEASDAQQISQSKAMELVTKALGLTRDDQPGWNAFSDFRQNSFEMNVANYYDGALENGASSKEALELVGRIFGHRSERQLHRLVSSGRKKLRLLDPDLPE